MLGAQRLELIKSYLIKNKIVDIVTLSSMLEVSDVTVRKDLDKLENYGFLIKTHGGAVLSENESETNFHDIENLEEKSKISKLALTTLDNQDSIFIGSGTTCLVFASFLTKFDSLSIVTNNVSAALNLSHVQNTVLLGGELSQKRGVFHTCGQSAIQSLDGTFFNKAYISADGIDEKAGFTYNNMSEMSILKEVLKNTKQVVVLTEKAKFDKICLYRLCTLDVPDIIVTSECTNNGYKEFFYEKDIKFLSSFDV